MQATRPSLSAKRIAIGSQYRPTRFERRDEMSYQALRPEQCVHADMLQRGLIGRGPVIRTGLPWWRDQDTWFIAALYALAAAFLAMHFAGWLPGQGA